MTARRITALTSDIDDIRALVADVAAEAARIATAIEAFGNQVQLVELIELLHRDGYEKGRAERDPHAADARARRARAQFKLIQPAEFGPL